MLDVSESEPSKTEHSTQFRERLNALLFKRKMSRNDFAALAGLNRSSISQLLSDTTTRLPRIETIVQISRALGVSVDWLLGLDDDAKLPADAAEDAATARAKFQVSSIKQEQFSRWRENYGGMKVRYLPTTFPDPLKSDENLAWQYKDHPEITVAEAQEGIAHRRRYLSRPGADMEVCTSVEIIHAFAKGEYLWGELPDAFRQRELDHMIEVYESVYPTFRWFCFDARDNFFAGFPVTIFGQRYASINLGQKFLLSQDEETISELTREFDSLVKVAVLQPLETLALLKSLRPKRK